jgi:hypothetical protein
MWWKVTFETFLRNESTDDGLQMEMHMLNSKQFSEHVDFKGLY